MGPTPFGGLLLILVQEAVHVEEDQLSFLKGVQAGGSIGIVSSLVGTIFIVSLGNVLGQQRSLHETSEVDSP